MLFDLSRFVYALVTSTTYGNWLPGDERGFVGKVVDGKGNRVVHNVHGTPYDKDMPALKKNAESRLKTKPVLFEREHAELMLPRWIQTVDILHWHLFAVAVMGNHVHLVVAAPIGTSKTVLLKQLKGWASRRLNEQFGKTTWWTESGSVRFSFDEEAHRTRIRYVLKQDNSLLVWENPEKFNPPD